jgi:hypothetical protein
MDISNKIKKFIFNITAIKIDKHEIIIKLIDSIFNGSFITSFFSR